MKHLISQHPLVREYQSLLAKVNLEIQSLPSWQRLKNFYESDEPFTLDKKIQYLDESLYPSYFKRLPSIGESLFFVQSESGVYGYRYGVTEFFEKSEQQKFIQNCLGDWADSEVEVRKEYTFWHLDHQLVGNLEQNIDFIIEKYEDGATFIIHLSSLEDNLKYTIV